jgi:hypothetical protein
MPGASSDGGRDPGGTTEAPYAHHRLPRGQPPADDIIACSCCPEPARLPPPGNEDPVSVLSVNRAYPWEVTKTRFGVTAEDHPSSLRCVSGDDQIVCSARGSGPADVGEQAPMMGCCRLRVVKDVDSRRYGYQCPGPFGRPASRIGQFDPDAVLGDRYRGDSKIVIIQRRAVHGPAFVSDQDVRVEDQASAHGSPTSESSRAMADAMSRPNASSGGGTSASAARRLAPVRRWAGPISATGWLPRTMVIVSPRSTASRRSEKCRDASVAVMVFTFPLYLIIRFYGRGEPPRGGRTAIHAHRLDKRYPSAADNTALRDAELGPQRQQRTACDPRRFRLFEL